MEPADNIAQRRYNLRQHILQKIHSIEDAWFPEKDLDGYYCWTKAKWIDIMVRSVELISEVGCLPPPGDEMLRERCWLASKDKLQVSAGSATCKPILYCCAYVLWNPSSREEMRSRQELASQKKRKSDARHVSHRCGDNKCWNPYHLVLEDAAANEDRKGCRYGALELCPHQPKCIFKKPCNLVITKIN